MRQGPSEKRETAQTAQLLCWPQLLAREEQTFECAGATSAKLGGATNPRINNPFLDRIGKERHRLPQTGFSKRQLYYITLRRTLRTEEGMQRRAANTINCNGRARRHAPVSTTDCTGAEATFLIQPTLRATRARSAEAPPASAHADRTRRALGVATATHLARPSWDPP